MADSFPSRPMPPSDWSQAFASLPPETPPADAWLRIAATLPGAMPRRRRSNTGCAIAATLAVAVGGTWLTMSAWREAPTTVAQQDTGPAVARPAHDGAAPADRVPTPTRPATTESSRANVDVARTVASTSTAPPPVAAKRRIPGTRSVATAEASTVAAVASTDTRDVASTDANATSTSTSLDDLRAESARLEALVAYARDERMQSAAAAMLIGDVDDRLHVIDAALSQTGLADSERLDLWSRRVDALRELAGLEGTQRWLAAHGESYEDALARVD